MAQKTLANEGFKLLEIRSINALNRTEKYNMVGTPQPGFGINNWCQIVVEKNGQTYVSGWVFRNDRNTTAICAGYGARNCARNLVYAHDFRRAVLGSLCLGATR
jgi:hypothetical protein